MVVDLSIILVHFGRLLHPKRLNLTLVRSFLPDCRAHRLCYQLAHCALDTLGTMCFDTSRGMRVRIDRTLCYLFLALPGLCICSYRPAWDNGGCIPENSPPGEEEATGKEGRFYRTLCCCRLSYLVGWICVCICIFCCSHFGSS